MCGKCILKGPSRETPIHSSFFSTSLIPSNIPMDVETAAWTFVFKSWFCWSPTSQQTSYSNTEEGLVIFHSRSNAPKGTESWPLDFRIPKHKDQKDWQSDNKIKFYVEKYSKYCLKEHYILGILQFKFVMLSIPEWPHRYMYLCLCILADPEPIITKGVCWLCRMDEWVMSKPSIY